MDKRRILQSIILHIVIYSITLILILSGIFSIRYIVDNNNKKEVVINIVQGESDNENILWQTEYVEPWGATADTGEYIIGSEYDCVLYNQSNVVFHDWTIELELPELGKIQNWWNCEYELKGEKVILTPVDYNVVVAPKSEIPIGFIMDSKEIMAKPNMVIRGYFEQPVRNVRMYWILCVLLLIWGVSLLVNILVVYFSKRYERQIAEKIERDIAREATYIAKGTKSIIERSVVVDLVEDSYFYLEKWSEFDSIPIRGTYEKYINYQVDIQTTLEEKENVTKILEKENLIKALQEKEEITYVSHSKNDIDIWKMTHVVVIERNDSVATKVLFIDMDITYAMEEQRKTEIILKDALYMAQCANKAKTTFLSNMSHDIRTPMNAIIGFTNLAASNLDDKEKVEGYLKKIESSSEHLLSLINNVLDMSRIESGKVEIEENILNLEEMVYEINNLLHSQAEEKNIDFKVNVDVSSKVVFCDKLRINQVLVNLISNAIKYTGEGGKVEFSILQNGCTHKGIEKYQFRVKDNGYGMDKEFAKHLFEPFEREAKYNTSNIQGTGLGLAITKNIIDMLGGIIEVDTKDGIGSEFIVYLDLKTVDNEENSMFDNTKMVMEHVEDFQLSGKRVLLVDDNEINLEIAAEILKAAGMEVEIATNGREAVEKFGNSKNWYFDMVLMDIQMPIMDGLEATKVIRKLDRQDVNIPIVALSANAFEEDVRKSLASGMDGHISKPIIIETLFETMSTIISTYNKR